MPERPNIDDFPGETLTVLQFAAVMGIGRCVVYDLVYQEKIPVLRFGPKKFRVSKAVARKLLEAGSLEALREV